MPYFMDGQQSRSVAQSYCPCNASVTTAIDNPTPLLLVLDARLLLQNDKIQFGLRLVPFAAPLPARMQRHVCDAAAKR